MYGSVMTTSKKKRAVSRKNKTRPTRQSATAFLKQVEPAQRRADALQLLKLFKEATGMRAVLWGSIIGFGRYSYTRVNGQAEEFMLTGFAPRKANLVVYIMPGFSKYTALLKRLGRFKHSKSCLYLNKLADVDAGVLQQLIARSVRDMQKKYSGST